MGSHRKEHEKIQRIGGGGYRTFDTVWVMVAQGIFNIGMVDNMSIYCINSE